LNVGQSSFAISTSSRNLARAAFGKRRGNFAFRIIEAIASDGLRDPVVDAAFEQQYGIGEEVISAEKIISHADRPGDRGHVQHEALLDLARQAERVADLAVELVDKGDDRHVAQPAALEEFAGLLLDPFGGVEQYYGAVDRGQGALMAHFGLESGGGSGP
jgi:hypothetical protein